MHGRSLHTTPLHPIKTRTIGRKQKLNPCCRHQTLSTEASYSKGESKCSRPRRSTTVGSSAALRRLRGASDAVTAKASRTDPPTSRVQDCSWIPYALVKWLHSKSWYNFKSIVEQVWKSQVVATSLKSQLCEILYKCCRSLPDFHRPNPFQARLIDSKRSCAAILSILPRTLPSALSGLPGPCWGDTWPLHQVSVRSLKSLKLCIKSLSLSSKGILQLQGSAHLFCSSILVRHAATNAKKKNPSNINPSVAFISCAHTPCAC